MRATSRASSRSSTCPEPPPISRWPASVRHTRMRPDPDKEGGMGMRSVLAAAMGGVVALAMMVPLSRATFPGTNGSLAYEAKIGKRYQMFTSNADGSAPQQLTHFADSDAVWAAWSPSGKQIAFERDVYTGVFVTRGAIYTMNAAGSGLRSLTPQGL